MLPDVGPDVQICFSILYFILGNDTKYEQNSENSFDIFNVFLAIKKCYNCYNLVRRSSPSKLCPLSGQEDTWP